ncbi:hypothetical protein GEMRC1_011468 [Eukaryota sp. GEM-RC1]
MLLNTTFSGPLTLENYGFMTVGDHIMIRQFTNIINFASIITISSTRLFIDTSSFLLLNAPLIVHHPSVFESLGVWICPIRGRVQVVNSNVTLKGHAGKSHLATEFELFTSQLIITMTGSPFLLVNAANSDITFDSYDLLISSDSSFEGSCYVITFPYSRVQFLGALLCQLNFSHSNGFLHFLANSVVHFDHVTVDAGVELIFEGTIFVDEIVESVLNSGDLRLNQVMVKISTLSSIGVRSFDTVLSISNSIISCFHVVLNSTNLFVSNSSFPDVIEELIVTNSNLSLVDSTVSLLVSTFDDVIMDMTNSFLFVHDFLGNYFTFTLRNSSISFDYRSIVDGSCHLKSGIYHFIGHVELQTQTLNLHSATVNFNNFVVFPLEFFFDDLSNDSLIVFQEADHVINSTVITFAAVTVFESPVSFKNSTILFNQQVIFNSSIHIENSVLFFESFALFTRFSSVDGDCYWCLRPVNGSISVNGNWHFSKFWLFDPGCFHFTETSVFLFDDVSIEKGRVKFEQSRDFWKITTLTVIGGELLFSSTNSLNISNLELRYGIIQFSDLHNLELNYLSLTGGDMTFSNFSTPVIINQNILNNGSFITFNTGFSVIIPSLSVISGNIHFYDVYFVQDASPTELNIVDGNCCSTFDCKFSLLDQAFVQNNIQISVQFSNGELITWFKNETVTDSLHFHFVNNSFPNIRVDLVDGVTQYLITSVVVPVCPPKIDSISSPKPMGDVIVINGDDFGHLDVQIIINSLNLSIYVLPFYHKVVYFPILPNDGCHILSLTGNGIVSISEHFCYQKPEILRLDPPSLPFLGHITVYGKSFGKFRISLSFFNSTVSYRLVHTSDTVLVAEIFHICTELPFVEFLVTVGEQDSNQQLLLLETPNVVVFPTYISKFNGLFYLQYPSLSLLSECLPFFSLNSQDSFNITSKGDNILAVEVPLIQSNEYFNFGLTFVKSSNLSSKFSLSIAGISALPMDSICFVDVPCTIHLYSPLMEIDLLYFDLDHDWDLTVINVHSSSSSEFSLTFIQQIAFKVPSICLIHTFLGSKFCFSNLPYVIAVFELTPTVFQFFSDPTYLSVSIIGKDFDLFTESQLTNSIDVGGATISNIDILPTLLSLSLSVPKIGRFHLLFSSAYEFVSHVFYFTVDNYISHLPQIPKFCEFSLTLSYNFHGIQLLIDDCIYELQPGAQLISISDPQSFQILNSLNIAFLNISTIGLQLNIPHIIGVDYVLTLTIDLSLFDGISVIDVVVPYCSVTFVYNQYLIVDVSCNDLGVNSFTLNHRGGGHYWQTSTEFSVLTDPSLSLFTRRFFNIPFSGFPRLDVRFDHLPENSAFTLNNSIDLVPVSRTPNSIVLALEHFNFNVGSFSNYSLIWSHPTFNSLTVDFINFFNSSIIEVVGSMSVDQSRNISFIFDNSLLNFLNFRCHVHGVEFPAIVKHVTTYQSETICLNVVSPVYQEFVYMYVTFQDSDIFYPTFVRVDSVFADVCYAFEQSVPRIPADDTDLTILNYNPFFLNIFSSILFSGQRCCDVHSSNCYVELKYHHEIVLEFSNIYDVWSLTVSYMSDCVETHSNLPFELSVPSDFIESVQCVPFPSGFLIASKCDVFFLKNSIIIDTLILTFWTGIQLTEIEVYGFPDHQCFNLANTTTGKNSFDNYLTVDTMFVFSGLYYSNMDYVFADYAMSLFDLRDVFVVNIQLFSQNCLNSYLPWTISLVPQSAASIKCNDVIQMMNDRSIKSDCVCRDLNGFPTSCFSLNSSDFVIGVKHNGTFSQFQLLS